MSRALPWVLRYSLIWVGYWSRAFDQEEVLMDGREDCFPCEYMIDRIMERELVGFNIGGVWKASCELRRREEWHGAISER